MASKKKLINYTNIIFACMLLFVGIKGAWWVFSDTRKILDSNSWKTADAVLLSKDIKTSYGYKGKRMFSPLVKYSFTVDNKPYEGTYLTIPPRRTSSRTQVEKTLARYNVNSEIEIYYNPENPEENCIVKPAFNPFFTFFLGPLALLFFFLGVLLLWLSVRRH